VAIAGRWPTVARFACRRADGNLDSTRAHELLALLREMVERDRLTVLLVTTIATWPRPSRMNHPDERWKGSEGLIQLSFDH